MTASSTDLRSENPTSPERDVAGRQRGVRSIVVCGASVRSLAESAFRSGFRPLCIDFFGDADLRRLLQRRRSRFVSRIDSFSQLTDIISSIRSEIPLLWAGGLENHVEMLRDIARNRQVIGPDLSVVEQLRNPFRFSTFLTSNGLRTPEISASTRNSHRTWIRKITQSSGGLGVELLRDTSHQTLTDSNQGYYFQEYIDGIPMSAAFVATSRDCRMIGVALQFSGWPTLGASGFQYCGNAGPVELPTNIEMEIERAGQSVYTQGLRGVFGIDFILRQGRVWFLEVNPRITGSHMIYEYTHSRLNLFREHLTGLGVIEENSCGTGPPSGKFALRAVIWSDKPSNSKLELNEQLWQVTEGIRLADIPESPEQLSVGTPLCSVEVVGHSLPNVLEQLRNMQEHPQHRTLCDWSAFSTEVSVFWQRLQENLTEEQRGQNPQGRQ
ncbi:MAG: ATP-grasp domain-containing protein [Planctomycetota bacterium]